MVGTWGLFAAYSFYPTKNMTTGEGGMIVTDDDGLADKVRLLRNQGMRERYRHEVVGMNERMTEIEAAIGLIQLGRLEEWNRARRANAEHYRQALDPSLGLPTDPEDGLHVYHQFTIRPPDRTTVTSALTDAGIGHGTYYPIPTHRQAPFGSAVDLPHTDAAAEQVVSIPVRPDLTAEERDLVVSTLNGCV